MPNAAATNPIQVLKPGFHTDANGVRVEFTEAMLQSIADVYDPAVHEAPFVVGHPKMDGPSYGWSKRFEFKDGVLFTEGDQVEEQFAGLVNEGRFKKVSLSLYSPTASRNPRPGTWYPRHVGFLGAMPPSIKGLKSVSFAEGEDGVHDFSDYASSSMLGMFRRLREWMLTQFGKDAADQVLPSFELDYAAESLTAERVRETTQVEGLLPAFAEAQYTGTGESEMSATLQATQLQAQLDAEKRRADDAVAALTARQKADADAAQAKLKAEALSFAELMVSEARVPADRRDQLVELQMRIANPDPDGQVLSFGEGDKAESGLKVLQTLIKQLPASVSFGELATRTGRDAADLDDVDGQVQFGEGTNLDPERLALHHDALRLQRQRKAAGDPIDYLDAVKAVQR